MYTKVNTTETQLLALLQRKNQEGYFVLYNTYSQALYGVLKKLVQSDNLAADLLEKSFVNIWRNLQFYDPAKGSLFVWMFTITRSLAIAHLKSISKHEPSLGVKFEKHLNQFNSHIKIR